MISNADPDNPDATQSNIPHEDDTKLIDTNDIDTDSEYGEPSDEPLTREGLLAALKRGVETGVLTKQQAAQIRFENGIFQSEFTKRKKDSKKEKAKRKGQRNARKITRRNGYKGLKHDKGKRIQANY